VTAAAVLHGVSGRPGTALERLLRRAPDGELAPLVGPFPRPVVRVTAPAPLLEEARLRLPAGAAQAEAAAVRLRRAGAELTWGEPDALPDGAAYVRLCHARGASSVAVVRADPSLLTELELGAFFNAFWHRRVARRLLCRLATPALLARAPGVLLAAAADAAFWLGVRSAATPEEWERLAWSSYVVFYYHGVDDEPAPEQAHLHVRRRRLDLQLRLLRLLAFRPLEAEELLSFHETDGARLPRRSYVVAADDGFRSVVAAFRDHARLHPQVYVNTAAVGTAATWAHGEPLADWDELAELRAAGGVVAAHGRGHPALPELADDDLADELAGALDELAARLGEPPRLYAYPYGYHDARVRRAVGAAGFRAAFTTAPGRNGAGTDPYCLRRLGVLDWDGPAAFLWKALTGELLPWAWERRRRERRS